MPSRASHPVVVSVPWVQGSYSAAATLVKAYTLSCGVELNTDAHGRRLVPAGLWDSQLEAAVRLMNLVAPIQA